MKNKLTITRIGEIKDSINKFGEENNMNRKILFGILIFIIVLFLTESYYYGLICSLVVILVLIKSINEYISKYLNLVEPAIYFLVSKYVPTFISALSLSKRAYQGVCIVSLVILATILLMHFDSLILSFYQGNLQKALGDKLMIWGIVSFLFIIIGNLGKLLHLFFKLILNWVFLLSYISIITLLDIETSTYTNVAISSIAPLIVISVLIYVYKPIYKEYIDKYDYFKLWFNESKNDWGKYISLLSGQSKKELNSILVISDNPIKYKNDDLFGYNDIADNTYNIIKGINVANGSYSIGIIGEWGLGKSSIIGILKESKLKLDSNIIIHEFNPWNYTKSDLINSFITEIASKVNKNSLTKLLIKYTELLSGINSTSGAIFKLVKSLFGTEKTIDEIRKEIGEELGKIDKKLVVIIDDLDRCEPEEIITMLNVVKNIGNFSHVIYLISFDKIHIIEALKTKGFHEDYIEKIINTEIHVPLPDKESKAKYFTEKFSEILSEIGIKETITTESCRIITESGNSGLDEIFEIENLRFIKKLLNKLNVSFKLIHNTKKDEISNLSENDIMYIVLINYVKIKYLELFNDSIQKQLQIIHGSPLRLPINEPGLYKRVYLNKIKNKFLREIIGLQVSPGGTNEEILFIGNISNNDGTRNLIKKNIGLLKIFS